jgi:hypothetical protein
LAEPEQVCCGSINSAGATLEQLMEIQQLEMMRFRSYDIMRQQNNSGSVINRKYTLKTML